MSSLFVLLFLLSIIFLIWGVSNPDSLSKKTKQQFSGGQYAKIFGAIAVIMIIFIGLTAPQEKSAETENTKKTVLEETVNRPVVKTETVTETEVVPFQKVSENSAGMLQGTSAVTVPGVNGIKTYTYELTYTDGEQTDKKLMKEEVTTTPVNEVTTVGTKVPPRPKPKQQASNSCDPNYAGACVPIASDVDCGGGSGNGPAYVYGTVRIVGSDIYGLDRDGDGYGCE